MLVVEEGVEGVAPVEDVEVEDELDGLKLLRSDLLCAELAICIDLLLRPKDANQRPKGKSKFGKCPGKI